MTAASEHPTHLLLHQDGVAWLYQLVGVLSDQARHDLDPVPATLKDVVPRRTCPGPRERPGPAEYQPPWPDDEGES